MPNHYSEYVIIFGQKFDLSSYNITCVTMLQVEACQSRLYVMGGIDPTADDVPKPTLDWKKACSKYILPEVQSVVCTTV